MPRPLRTRTRIGPFPNEAARQLWLLMSMRNWGEPELEYALKLTGQATHAWLYCDRLPGLYNAVRIWKVLGISPDLWLELPVQDLASAMGRRAA